MNDMLAPTDRLKRHKDQDKLILPQTAELVEKFTELICDVSLSINEYTRRHRIGTLSMFCNSRLRFICIYQSVYSLHLGANG